MSAAGKWRVWLDAARPRTLPAAVAPVLVGSALAIRAGVFMPGTAVICLGFALLIQIGTNFANDYYDFVKGSDTPERVGPRRAVSAGLVSGAAMRRAMILVFTAAFALGLSLVAVRGWMLVPVGVLSILCGYAYTGGPYPLGYHGLGDIFVFVFFGLVAVGTTFFVQAGWVNADVFLAAAAIGLLTANILVVNNYRDVATDAKAGKRTLVVRFGRSFASAQYALALAGGAAAPLLLAGRGFGPWVLLPLVLLPWGWAQWRALRRSQTPAEQIRLLGTTAGYLALYSVLFSAGLVLA